ncbi:unnamed protein product [Hydatigera taeniaeformis]|uniref:BURP domain-containing protein n=1 Tax=Hydatigena taeniaeformis TaxID=6205 RepID=A0A0R3WX24_HYDTA|nr:unnamed protein product [Hydatigera taeniaeformis]
MEVGSNYSTIFTKNTFQFSILSHMTAEGVVFPRIPVKQHTVLYSFHIPKVMESAVRLAVKAAQCQAVLRACLTNHLSHCLATMAFLICLPPRGSHLKELPTPQGRHCRASIQVLYSHHAYPYPMLHTCHNSNYYTMV